jgi:hypothetical protein
MPNDDAEQVIGRAVARGAFSAARAGEYREYLAGGGDPAVIEAMPGNGRPIMASAPTGRVAAAGAPPGADAALFAANPLLFEMQRDKPALTSAAMADNPHPPKLFFEFDADLPGFTSSGLDPAILATMPWPARRPIAEASTLAGAYELVARYGGPDADGPALLALRYSRSNTPYLQAFSEWLAGPPQGTQPGSGPARHPSSGRFVKGSAPDDLSDLADDYTGQALFAELFGPLTS